MYTIEKGIPIPESQSTLAGIIRSMEIGDSVEILETDRAKVSQYGKVNGVKLKTKTIDGVLRMWRVA